MLIAIVAGLLMPPFLIIKNRARAPFSCRGGGMVGTHTASQPVGFPIIANRKHFEGKRSKVYHRAIFFLCWKSSIISPALYNWLYNSSLYTREFKQLPIQLARSIHPKEDLFSAARHTVSILLQLFIIVSLYTHTHKLVLLSLSALNLLISNVSVRMMKFLSEHITLSIFSSKVSSSESLKK